MLLKNFVTQILEISKESNGNWQWQKETMRISSKKPNTRDNNRQQTRWFIFSKIRCGDETRKSDTDKQMSPMLCCCFGSANNRRWYMENAVKTLPVAWCWYNNNNNTTLFILLFFSKYLDLIHSKLTIFHWKQSSIRSFRGHLGKVFGARPATASRSRHRLQTKPTYYLPQMEPDLPGDL